MMPAFIWRLSSALRQRLLVLNEATITLETKTERLISKTLNILVGGVHSIDTAHRLATVWSFNQAVD